MTADRTPVPIQARAELHAQIPESLALNLEAPAGVLIVYAYLDLEALKHGKDSWSTSVRALAGEIGMPKSTVADALAWLLEADYLRREPSDYPRQTAFVLSYRRGASVRGGGQSGRRVSGGADTTVRRGGHSRDRTSLGRETDQQETELRNQQARMGLFVSSTEELEALRQRRGW